MMTSSNGSIFRVTDPFSGEFTEGKGQWRGALIFSLICARINGWVNNGDTGDLRRHRAHCDVNVMISLCWNVTLMTHLCLSYIVNPKIDDVSCHTRASVAKVLPYITSSLRILSNGRYKIIYRRCIFSLLGPFLLTWIDVHSCMDK